MSDKKNDVKAINPSPAPARKEIYKAQSTHDQGRSLADNSKGTSKPPTTSPANHPSNSGNNGNSNKKE